MKRLNLLLTGAGFLVLSLVLNHRWLYSWRMDMDGLNASTVIYLGRVDLLRMLRWLAFTKGGLYSYEPVTNFSYWLIYDLLNASGPQGFRWFEIVLQAANSLLVGWVATRWVRHYRWAALAGLIYLMHPMHLNWSCMGVSHYLATFFILCGLLLHSGTWNANPGKHAAVLCALYFLAAFSKESGAFFPLFLLCLDAAASLSESSRSEFWKRRLVPYLGLSAVAIFYVWARRDMLYAGLHAGEGIDTGRRFWEALRASRYGPVFPAAFIVPLLARKPAPAAYFARVSFCAAWFVVGILLFLGLLPMGLPAHVQSISPRYLFLPMAGIVWLLALALDLCGQSWGSVCAAVLALLALVPSLPDASSPRSSRREELASIEQGLAQCASPVRPNWTCVQAALSLPFVRRDAPEAFEKLAKTVQGIWSGHFLGFFARQPFDGAAPKWRCLAQAMQGNGELEDCVKADQAFETGMRLMREGRYAAAGAAFDAATGSWPSFTEAFFQKARALSATHDSEGAALNYDRALHSPMAYYLMSALTSQSCAPPKDDSCRFLERTGALRDGELFRATGRTWTGAPPHRRITLSADQMLRRAERRPRDLDLWLDLASAASEEGRRSMVLEALSHAEGLAPDREQLERMVRLYQDALDWEATVRILDRLVNDFPFDPRHWNDRAVARIMLKDDAGALRDLERALSADPDFLSASLTLGGLHVSMGQKNKALKVYEAALKRPVRRGEPAEMRRLIREERDRMRP